GPWDPIGPIAAPQVTIVSDTDGGGPSGDPRAQGDVEKADVVDGIKESLSWAPPPMAGPPPQPCPFQALCARFKDLLLLPDGYFTPEPRRSRCFCDSCVGRGGGEEGPRDPPAPRGWCRFGLRPKPRLEPGGGWQKWPLAYHGTSAGAVRRSLDQGELVPGPWCLRPRPPGGPAHGAGSQPSGPARLVLSPALPYAAMEPFARVT
ncbi:neuralized-like protein 4, partial [Pezoporus wallicus]|uniref:neuralized-like protein 4 n=1 Tax=Pezoporus wallicus TaxID=35540 RepID=UPI00254CFB13